MDRPHVVIVGAGFGGLTAVRSLGDAPVDVTLIDQYNFHTFSPLLYQVATAGVAPDDIAPSVRGVVRRERNAEFHMARVVGIDFGGCRVLLADGDPVTYDYLILAVGAVSSDFGVPGVREHALALKSLEDAIRVRSTVLKQFEVADRNHELIKEGALRVVVAGGGPTGVELSGALAELFTMVLAKDFATLDIDSAEVVLIEATGSLLSTFSAPSQVEAVRELEARGVQVRLSTTIASVDPGGVELADGTRVVSRAGDLVRRRQGESARRPARVAAERPRRSGRERRPQRPDAPRGVRDRRPRRGHRPPRPAVSAAGAGRHATGATRCAQHRAQETREKTHRFHYVDKGTMATIGQRSAVAELPFGIRLGGTLGWLSWLALHLVFLVGFRNRVVVLVNWVWNYLTWDRGNRIIIPPD